MKQNAGKFYLVFGIILLGVVLYQLQHITGPVLFPDEFGYWANAAAWLGYDWSGPVSIQSFYSFGYSVLLMPLLHLIENPYLLYKFAVALNAIFIYLHGVLLWNVIQNEDKKNSNPWYCLVAVLYPGLLFYIQLTMTESLLSLLFLCCVWLFQRYGIEKRNCYAVILFLILTYLYFVHMRSIGIVAAAVIACLYGFIINQKRSYPFVFSVFGVAILVFVAFLIMKGIVRDGLYRDVTQELWNANNYIGQLHKITALVTVKGLKSLIVSLVGKIFYLGAATFGIFYYGVWHILKKVKNSPLNLFLILSLFFSVIVSAVYLMFGGRGDLYLYGRYHETVVPLFIYYGLCEMAVNKRIIRVTSVLTLVQSVLACITMHGMAQANPRLFQGYFTVGISGYLPREVMPDISDYVIYPLIGSIIALWLLTLVMGLFVRRKKEMVVYLGLFAGMYLYAAISAGNKYLYDHSNDINKDMEMALKTKEMMQPGEKVVFYDSDSDVQYLDIIQFCLREMPLAVKAEKEMNIPEDKADYCFVYQSSTKKEMLEQYYNKSMETYHFKLYYGMQRNAGLQTY